MYTRGRPGHNLGLVSCCVYGHFTVLYSRSLFIRWYKMSEANERRMAVAESLWRDNHCPIKWEPLGYFQRPASYSEIETKHHRQSVKITVERGRWRWMHGTLLVLSTLCSFMSHAGSQKGLLPFSSFEGQLDGETGEVVPS